MIVRRRVAPFLHTSRTVEFATARTGERTLATERYELTDLESYGTMVEAPARAPEPGPPLDLEVSTFGPDATRIRVHRGAAPIESSVLRTSARIVDPAAAGVEIEDDPFTLRAVHGRLRSRPVEIDALRRITSSASPPHEQRWQVRHRFADPLGTTADDEPIAGTGTATTASVSTGSPIPLG